MALEIKQTPKLVQQLVITPQLQQAIKLLQLTRIELVDIINQEMKENPLLEEDEEEKDTAEEGSPIEQVTETIVQEIEHTPEVKGEGEGIEEFDWENYIENYNLSTFERQIKEDGEERPNFENFITKKTTLLDHLNWQLELSNLTDEEKRIGSLIIGNLDEDGYLKQPLEDLSNEANISIEFIEEVLKKIQRFDPVGVGARDLRECLIIQLEQLEERDPIAEKIVSEHLSLLKNRNYHSIAKKLGVSVERVARAAKIISRLEPKPGRPYSGEIIQEIVPDVYVYKVEGEYVVYLNDEGIPKIRISPLYRDILSNIRSAPENERRYIQEKLRSAIWLIRSIHQRQRTIYKVAKSIVKFQKEFLDNGINFLKPLVLRDVAEDINMHESTISRVTHNKYMYTPQGIYEFKFFFNSGISSRHGELLASESVKNLIKEIISKEDPRRPYSDEQLVQILKGMNINIARRTVSKYREMMRILSSNERKKVI